MNIICLNNKFEESYETFLHKSPQSSFFFSNKYRLLLKKFLKSDDYYFIALDGENILGVLPSFLKNNSEYGNILNSLPFYGSNGGIICDNSKPNVKIELLNKFYEVAIDNNCISSTIVTSPFEKYLDFYENNSKYDYKDRRIGQLTKLSDFHNFNDTDLLLSLNKKNRNLIRKAQKLGIKIEEMGKNSINFLYETHSKNISELGGIPKEDTFFYLIPKIFEHETEYKIFVATLDGVEIAALLLFYYNNIVEYFTPVIVKGYRSYQPMSLLIFESMKDAIHNKYTWWNWGGTWESLKGVYNFKKSWGAIDMYYYYYNRIFNKEIINYPKETFLNNYQYFYAIPFERLIK